MRVALVLLGVSLFASDVAAQRGSARLVREIAITDDAMPKGFTRVGGVLVGPQKQIFVEQPQDNAVQMFDSTGKFVRSIGGKGQGPGETELLNGIGFVGDSLWTFDVRARRFAFFSQDGTYRSTLTVPAIIDTTVRSAGVRVFASTPLANGDLYYGAVSYASQMEGVLLPPVAQVVGTRDGKRVRVVAMTDSLGRGAYGIRSGTRETHTQDPMFGSLVNLSTLVTVGGGGSWFAIARREECGRRPRYTVARTSLSGDTLWKATVECPRVTVPTGFIDSIVAVNRDRVLARMQVPVSYAEAQIRGNLRMSGFTPARGLQVGHDGSIWVRPFTTPGDSIETWIRADQKTGTPNQFTLPARSQLKVILDADHIWVLQLDDDDVPTLVRYRLQLPAS